MSSAGPIDAVPFSQVVLRGERVLLRPMAEGDIPALIEAALDPVLWTHTVTRMETADDVRAYVRTALDLLDQGVALPFVTTVERSGRIVGSTRLANIDRVHRRAEIGWTWVVREYQRTFVNTEAKLLMLQLAFDRWRLERVELKTGTRNEASRRAILRIGAKEEGILRRHMLLPDGSYRDTVYYSILRDEWPDVRSRLRAMLRG